MKGEDGKIATSNQDKAEIFNEHSSIIGENMAYKQAEVDYPTSPRSINRVTPTVMDIDLKYETGLVWIPSLLSLYNLSASSNCLPGQWKWANVYSL